MKLNHDKINAYASAFAALVAGIALFVSLREASKHKPAKFVVNGPCVELRDDFGNVIKSRQFGDEGCAIFKTLDQRTKDYQIDHFAFVLENRAKNKNALIVISSSLETVFRYEFEPKCPFPPNAQQAEFRPTHLVTIPTKEELYYCIIFVDENYPSVIDIVKQTRAKTSGESVARLWHQGHLYSTTMLGDLLVCCGKNNSFDLRRRSSPTIPEAKVTYHHPVVFAIPLAELIRGKSVFGPTGSRRGEEKGLKFQPYMPMANFKWYYLLDEPTPDFDGFGLDAKEQIQQVAFTTPTRWRYFFDSSKLARPPVELTGWTNKASTAKMVLPKDETGELRLP